MALPKNPIFKKQIKMDIDLVPPKTLSARREQLLQFINEDGTLSNYDWKRCKSVEKFVSYNQFALGPVSHLPDTNFWHYSIQLNTYKLIIERNYGYTIKGMYLVCIHPELDTNYQIHEVEPMNMTPLIEYNK